MSRKAYMLSACALALAAGWLWLRPDSLREIAGERAPRALSRESGEVLRPVALPRARARDARVVRDPDRPGSAQARYALPPAVREVPGEPPAAGAPRPPSRRFRSGKRQYEVREGLYALPENVLPPELADRVVSSRFGFALFSTEDLSAVPEGALPVVATKGKGAFAVLTGKLVVQLNPQGSPEALANDFGVEVVHSVDHLNVAFLRGTGSDVPSLIGLLEALRKDARVGQADLELIEGRMVPQ